MAITAEQMTSLFQTLQDTMEGMKRMQTETSRVYEENNRLQSEMIQLLKEKNEAKTEEANMTSHGETNGSFLNQSMTTKGRPYRAKPTRPKVETELSDLEWQVFMDAWNRYKRLTELVEEEELCLELRECCSPGVN